MTQARKLGFSGTLLLLGDFGVTVNRRFRHGIVTRLCYSGLKWCSEFGVGLNIASVTRRVNGAPDGRSGTPGSPYMISRACSRV